MPDVLKGSTGYVTPFKPYFTGGYCKLFAIGNEPLRGMQPRYGVTYYAEAPCVQCLLSEEVVFHTIKTMNLPRLPSAARRCVVCGIPRGSSLFKFPAGP